MFLVCNEAGNIYFMFGYAGNLPDKLWKLFTLGEFIKGDNMYADENVIKIKHEVLYEVAKAAFDGNLDEIRDNIPFNIIPGPTPQLKPAASISSTAAASFNSFLALTPALL